jgi:hypothetical protein
VRDELTGSEAPPPGPGGPSRRGWTAVGVAVAVALGVTFLLAGRSRRPPDLSPTLEHRAALGGRDAQACLSCHARGAAPRRSPSHTGREDCWSCHVVNAD